MPKPPSREGSNTREKAPRTRSEAFLWLVKGILPFPSGSLSGSVSGASGSKGKSVSSIDLIDCSSYGELQIQWKEAMQWTEGLETALAVMLASVTSTRAVGDQLWVKILAPAASGKSTLCEALSANRKYVFPKDTFTGLSSGYQVDDEGAQNLSLVEQLADKTLIINDGDSLLQLPNLGQILSQLRAFYGGNLRTSYKNKMSKDHEGYRTTVILCGTSSLKAIDSSELGERFLDCIIMDQIDDDLEDQILMRVADRACANLELESGADLESQTDPEMKKAIQMTGGYVEYLRNNATELLIQTTMSDRWKMVCTRLGKFVAFMRARPSLYQSENAEREFGARLTAQHIRLARCLAVVMSEESVNSRVMKKVLKVSLDTAKGPVLELIRHLHDVGENGAEAKGIGIFVNQRDQDCRKLLRFLSRLGATEAFVKKGLKTNSVKTKWRLTPMMKNLFETVMSLEL